MSPIAATSSQISKTKHPLIEVIAPPGCGKTYQWSVCGSPRGISKWPHSQPNVMRQSRKTIDLLHNKTYNQQKFVEMLI